ncbi:5'/3'-nucleotidase SurE [Neisseriaceae bacterium ESL0693]|nr:5'/3'-nucleotidase SurE [Neisseriaceae bacterium ESL0693]
MNILICNDDGYLAKGIALLAKIAANFGQVRVVAPQNNRSGASNSLTLDRPLNIHQADNGFYFVNGTPTDCIHIALHTQTDFKPDLVLSGINDGANMGDDVLYSGTVAAATEAYLMGIPAVAFSLNDRTGQYWDTAEKAVTTLLQRLVNELPPEPILWNVNIPAVTPDNLQGCRISRLGRRFHEQCVLPAVHPYGAELYWIGGIGQPDKQTHDTDFSDNAAGYVTITPLSTDLTHHKQLMAVGEYWQDITL